MNKASGRGDDRQWWYQDPLVLPLLWQMITTQTNSPRVASSPTFFWKHQIFVFLSILCIGSKLVIFNPSQTKQSLVSTYWQFPKPSSSAWDPGARFAIAVVLLGCTPPQPRNVSKTLPSSWRGKLQNLSSKTVLIWGDSSAPGVTHFQNIFPALSCHWHGPCQMLFFFYSVLIDQVQIHVSPRGKYLQ